MWCRWGTTITAVTFGITASLVSYEFATVAQSQSYTVSQLHAVLRGFGYTIPQGGGTAAAQATQKAVRDFQQHYNLKVDGTAGVSTQQVMAALVKNLQGSLNLVVKPNPPLPRTQFYTAQTAAAVKQFQKQSNLPVTGIANLEVRSRLDQDARRALGGTSSPSQSPSPSMSPSMSPSESPSMSPSMSPSESPSMSPSISPSSSP